MRIELKRKLGKLWPAPSHSRKIILLYHSISGSPWAMFEKTFNDQIDWINDHCDVLSLTDLLQSPPKEKIQVAITFDDGYVSLYDKVAAKLSEKNMDATVYINTGWIGDGSAKRKKSYPKLGHYPEESFMIWPEIEDLHRAGWEIGSHGVNHYNLAQLTSDVLETELSHSKYHIEEQLQKPCIHLAYPFGRYSKTVKDFASTIGYQYAAAAYHAPLKNNCDLFAFPRLNIAKEYSMHDFKNIIHGKWDYLKFIHKMKGF